MTKKNKASAGQRGENIRSDCFISRIEIKESGGIDINLISKVQLMYGTSIKEQIKLMCSFFEIEKCTYNY
jgi:citrate lyase subunit beta / citryl-CoA lyase